MITKSNYNYYNDFIIIPARFLIMFLTKLALYTVIHKQLHCTILVEEVFVHTSPSKQPDVAVVSDCAVCEIGRVEPGTLSLCFRRTEHKRHAK